MNELSRRRFVQAGGVAAAAVTAGGAVASPASAAPAPPGRGRPLRPADPQAGHLPSPLGIDAEKPTLSWRFAPGPSARHASTRRPSASWTPR